MNLTEIKEMLGKISPWPWKWSERQRYNSEETPYCTLASSTEDKVISSCDGCNNLGDKKEDCEFIAQAPTIISDLVKRVEDLESDRDFNEKTYFDMAKRIKDLELKYQAARDILIKSWRPYVDDETIDNEIAEEGKRLRKRK